MSTSPMDHDHHQRLQKSARDHLWLHFSRMGTYKDHDIPVIVKGDGAYIWDAEGRRYLDGLAGLFVTQVGHGRTELAEAAAKQASTLAFFPLWSYAHPSAIELAERVAYYAPGDLNRVFFTTGGGEAVESAWKLAKHYFKLTGKPGKHKVISRAIAYHGTTAGRAVDHRHPAAEGAVRAAGALDVPGAEHQLLPRARRLPERRDGDLEAFGRWAADRSRRPSRRRAPTPSRPSSSSRCRTPAAASRRRPATSSGCARSATSTTCCWSPTRSSAPSAGSATCSAPSATATSPTSSPAPRA